METRRIQVPSATVHHAEWLERFSNSREVSGNVQGGFFLEKSHSEVVLSLYTNWRAALEDGKRKPWKRWKTKGVFHFPTARLWLSL
jgi:hypothetical protein